MMIESEQKVIAWRRFLLALIVFASGAALAQRTELQTLELPVATNITIEAGDTLRIEYLIGGTTLYKSGEGRLEVAVVANTNLDVVVSNGTFATARPTTLDLSGDANIIFHLDANCSSTLTTSVDEFGETNFVTGVSDADGRTDRTLSTLAGRPNAFLSTMSASGLPSIDLGSLHNTAADGYGAALAFSSTIATAYEILYVFEDDSDAKNRSHSVGPCFCAAAASTWNHLRGYIENGTNAPILSTGGVGGRVQDGNYIDGVKRGATDYGTGKYYNSWPVPGGTHVLRRKVNTTASAAFEAIEGLGYYSKHDDYLSYGGLKIGEVIFIDTTTGYDTISDKVSLYQTYLMRKWLDVAGIAKMTILNNAELDVSAAPLKAQIQWDSTMGGTLTGGTNLWPVGYYEAGLTPVSVSGGYSVPRGQTQLPAMSFSSDAAIDVGHSSLIARLEGSGTLRKTGPGTLTVGVHDEGITSIAVDGGTLKIAPLNASGSFLHVDATDIDSITRAAEGSSAVSKWVDAENGANWLYAASVPYAWDTSRKTASPFVSDVTQNSLPLVDFGPYTTKLHPDGSGGAFLLSSTLAATGEKSPGARHVIAMWGDYDEVKNLPSNIVNGVAKGLHGPALYGGGSAYGKRGFGGGGASFPMQHPYCPARYDPPNGECRIDGTTVGNKTYRPGDGMHVLDQKIGDTGAGIDYIGGMRWCGAYDGASDSADGPGVWGGIRMGELLIYRTALPGWFRRRIAAALEWKWFNRTNMLEYTTVSVAKGASLTFEDASMTVETLTLAGDLSAPGVTTTEMVLHSCAAISGDLAMPDGATITFNGDSEGTFPQIGPSSLSLAGDLTMFFNLDEKANFRDYIGEHLVIAGDTSDFANVQLNKPVLSEYAKSLNLIATLEVRADGLYCNLRTNGLLIILR